MIIDENTVIKHYADNKEVEAIHLSMLNGQGRQAVELIDEYGNYDFWSDYLKHLDATYYQASDQFKCFSQMCVTYSRIKNR